MKNSTSLATCHVVHSSRAADCRCPRKLLLPPTTSICPEQARMKVHLHHKGLKMRKLRQSLWVSNSRKAPPGYKEHLRRRGKIKGWASRTPEPQPCFQRAVSPLPSSQPSIAMVTSPWYDVTVFLQEFLSIKSQPLHP